MLLKLYFVIISLSLILAVDCFSQNNSLDGYCEIYSTALNDLDESVFLSNGFRNTWDIVTQFKNGGDLYVLFYDRANGQAVLFNADMSLNRTYNNLRKTWSIIIAKDFNGDGNDELFFYDAFNGKAEVYEVGNYLELLLKSSLPGFRSTWKDIICLDGANENKNEFLFYDAKNRAANVYRIYLNAYLQYSVDSVCGVTGWNNKWKLLKKITFADGAAGVLGYDPFNSNAAGHISLFKYTSTAPYFTEISLATNYPKNITNIESGNFGDGLANGNLLFYIRETGNCSFYKVGNDNLFSESFDLSWRDSWVNIVTLKSEDSTDNVLFYEAATNNEITVKTYDGTNQAVHPDVIKGHDGKYKMVYTPFPYSNDDFENPSVLESEDGITFTEIAGARKPLIDMPTRPPPFTNSYNNDPDVFYESGRYYMFFNQTYSRKDIFQQNVKVVSYDSNFANADSNTIIAQPNYFRMTFSPSIVKSGKKYYMFFVNRAIDNRFKVSFISSDSLRQGWDRQIIQSVVFNTTQDFQPWHINVVKNDFDGYYYMLIAGKYKVASSKVNDLYVARSTDMVRWELAPEPLMRKENYGYVQLYRSAGIFTSKNNLMLWYSFFRADDQTGVGYKRNMSIEPWMFNGGQKIEKKTVVQLANYPNPFNATTRINFDVPGNSSVTLKVYDIRGREVARLRNNENLPAGNYTSSFNGNNLASGVYYCVISVKGAEEFTSSFKMLLIK
ncbi:MAG: T9SS type A sorting domain-containing protein [Ignavibacteria bacterium]